MGETVQTTTASNSDINMILNEIKTFQQRQTKMEEIVKTVFDENQKLQRQHQQLYERDRKNRNTMGKIVQVLYQLVNKDGGNSQTVNNIKEIIGTNTSIMGSRKRGAMVDSTVPKKRITYPQKLESKPIIEHVHTPPGPTIVEVPADISSKTVSGMADDKV